MPYRELAEAAIKAKRSKNTVAAKKLAADFHTPACAVYAVCNTLLGVGWTAWLPETVNHEYEREGGSPEAHDKLGACLAIAGSGAPWWTWQGFAAVVNALNDVAIDPSGFKPPDVHHMAAAVMEMTLIYGFDHFEDVDPDWSDEVEAYVAAALAHHGFPKAPPELAFAQERLTKLLPEPSKEKDASEESSDPSLAPSVVNADRLADVAAYVEARNKLCLAALRELNG